MKSKDLYLLIRGWEYVERESFLELFNPLVDVHDLAKWLNQNKLYPKSKFNTFLAYNNNEPMVSLVDLLTGESHSYTLFRYTANGDITAYLKSLYLLSEYLVARYDTYKEVLDSFFLSEYADYSNERELYVKSAELENEWSRIISITIDSIMTASKSLYDATIYQKEHNNYYNDVYQSKEGLKEYEILTMESFILPPSTVAKKAGNNMPTHYFNIHYIENGRIELIMLNTKQLEKRIKISPFKSKIIFDAETSKVIELRLNRKYSRLFIK